MCGSCAKKFDLRRAESRRAVVVPNSPNPEEGQCVPLIDAVVVEKSPIPEESNSVVEDNDVRN